MTIRISDKVYVASYKINNDEFRVYYATYGKYELAEHNLMDQAVEFDYPNNNELSWIDIDYEMDKSKFEKLPNHPAIEGVKLY